MLKYGSLFSGYGGLDMGVQSVLGGETAWFCEFDKAPSKILAHHWPDTPNLGDITKVDWTQVEPVDVLTGGSPCQDLSQAGKRAGMTEGTRSNLWVQMREAIAALRPRLIVWENVRGALSAEATSDLEPCPGCLGDPRDRGPVLRALGRVLGDLAELGYDARWYGLRAADVGGAHGRFRVFLFATPADAGGLGGLEAVEHDGSGAQAGDGAGVPDQSDRDVVRPGPERDLTLLPTPTARSIDYGQESIDRRLAERASPGLELSAAVSLLPTPRAQAREHVYAREDHHNNLEEILGYLHEGLDPRPSKRQDDGDLTLLPTPTTTQRGTDANLDTREGARANLHNEVANLLPTPTAVTRDRSPEEIERRWLDGERGNRGRNLDDMTAHVSWGDYSDAIARWETVLGRAAPPPTEIGAARLNRHGNPSRNPRLSPHFVEWLMGLPAGHVTDVGITRSEQLKALGNGVVPQQAAAATRAFLEDTYQVPAGAPAVDVDGPLLPTPNVFHMGNTEQPDEWRRRRADVFKRTGTRHGPALPVVALSIEQGDPLTPDNYMPEEDD